MITAKAVYWPYGFPSSEGYLFSTTSMKLVLIGDNNEVIMTDSLESVGRLVSLQDVNNYFYCDADEACKEMTDLFVDRMIDDGFDSSVDLKLRGKLMIWALSDPGYEAGELANKILRHIKSM